MSAHTARPFRPRAGQYMRRRCGGTASDRGGAQAGKTTKHIHTKYGQILQRFMHLPPARQAAHGAVAAQRGRAGGIYVGGCIVHILFVGAAARDEPPISRARLLHRRHNVRLQRPQGYAYRQRRHLHRRRHGCRQRPHIRLDAPRRDAPSGCARGSAPLRTEGQDAERRASDAPQGGQISGAVPQKEQQ